MGRAGTSRDGELTRRLAMSGLVSTVMMATLVVGPFYLSGALGLDVARVGHRATVAALRASGSVVYWSVGDDPKFARATGRRACRRDSARSGA
jgi:hypothetical protein